MSCYWRHAKFRTFCAFYFAFWLAVSIHQRNPWWAIAIYAVLTAVYIWWAGKQVKEFHERQYEEYYKVLEEREAKRKAVFWHTESEKKEEE
jgi:hypothetical protein